MTRLTTQRIVEMKTSREVIAMVTAYDATFARLIDQAGADVLLVGDSLGMVVQGHGTTLPVTMEHMIYHCQAVVRGSERAVVVCDLPFMSYQVSVEQALTNGGRLMAEGGCQAVKLEGGQRTVRAVRALVDAGIPVCGHIGLTPQSVNALGGFLVQGRSEEAAKRLLEDALALQDAGAFALVLEGMPLELAVEITEQLAIPTVGIGAGAGCDGQVLVCYDLLGLYEAFKPKFVKRYATLGEATREAVGRYVEEVRQRAFPDDEHSFS